MYQPTNKKGDLKSRMVKIGFSIIKPLKVLVRLYGLGGGLSGTGDEGTVPITCLKMPVTRVEEQGKSLFSPYLDTCHRLKYANLIEDHSTSPYCLSSLV